MRTRRRGRVRWRAQVVIVEDSSPDGTYEVALQLQKFYGKEHIKILKRAGKLGLGSAYKEGLALAAGNFVFLMDADMSHHVRDPTLHATTTTTTRTRTCPPATLAHGTPSQK